MKKGWMRHARRRRRLPLFSPLLSVRPYIFFLCVAPVARCSCLHLFFSTNFVPYATVAFTLMLLCINAVLYNTRLRPTSPFAPKGTKLKSPSLFS